MFNFWKLVRGGKKFCVKSCLMSKQLSHDPCLKNAEWDWVGDQDSLSSGFASSVCPLFFGSYSQGGKFPPLTLLTHSWVVWNNRWLPSNQMPHHQLLSLCWNGLLAANRTASIGGKRLDHWAPACDFSADSDWLWARDLAFVGAGGLCSWLTSLYRRALSVIADTPQTEKSRRVLQELKRLISPPARELSHHQMWPRLPLFSRKWWSKRKSARKITSCERTRSVWCVNAVKYVTWRHHIKHDNGASHLCVLQTLQLFFLFMFDWVDT